MKQRPTARLLVEGKFVTLDPGSRTKAVPGQFWRREILGQGGGHGEGLDRTHARDLRAEATSAPWDSPAATQLGKLMADSRSIGEDIAMFLARWETRRQPQSDPEELDEPRPQEPCPIR